MASLLGQFFPYIKGSQEDIASKGLVYILQSSRIARDALSRFINNRVGLILPDLKYLTQITGEQRERPDISGYTEIGEEKIIIEAKFWASLTENQPVAYLERLKNDSVLLFICPSLRKISLLGEVERKLRDASVLYAKNDDVLAVDGNKLVCIADWNTVLTIIKEELVANDERSLISDIDQIIGFCKVIDDTALLPINDSDLSPSIPKKINSYCDLLDKVVDRLVSAGNITTEGLRSAGTKYCYTRYAAAGKYGLSLEINYKLWETAADTPFWFLVKNAELNKWPWPQPIELQTKLRTVSSKTNISVYDTPEGIIYFALIPPLNEVEEKIIDVFSRMINLLLTELEIIS